MVTCPVTFKVGDAKTGLSASKVASTSVRIPFGVNASEYAAVSPSLPGVTWTKWFAGGGAVNGIPPAWPDAKQVPPGTTTMACINPTPSMVLAGKLDSPLSAFLDGAPGGSWWTAWQECNDPASPYQSQAGASPSQAIDMHGYLHALSAKVNPSVLYGQDFGVLGGKSVLTPYVAPGMSFYSLDGYQHAVTDTAASVFGTAWAGVLAVEPSARPAITETNTTATTDGSWFESCFEWLCGLNGVLFSWWGGVGTHYTYSVPPAAGNLAALTLISAQCAA